MAGEECSYISKYSTYLQCLGGAIGETSSPRDLVKLETLRTRGSQKYSTCNADIKIVENELIKPAAQLLHPGTISPEDIK